MKKLSALLFIILIAFSEKSFGQYVTKQAGIRSGYRSGLFAQVTRESGNAESGYCGIISFNRGIQLTGLKVIYESSLSGISPDLFLAYGFGGHAGFSYTDHYSFFGEKYYFERYRYCAAVGADGWIAAEYRFHEIPVNISLNLKPFVEITVPSFVRIVPWDIGVSISYVF
ncbi:MAG TPA: hypothetical protein VHO46_02320 [Bacteroidales bacterium]|nr:hypothetical protein [Bacteroidales bacterium]